MAKTAKKNWNEKYIVVGHNVNGKILGHPNLGLPAGKVVSKKELYDIFLALAYFSSYEECYGDVSCDVALKSDLKKGFFAKI